MENKLVFYNMGTIKINKMMFLSAIEKAFGISEEEMEKVVGGYKFLFDSETDGNIVATFYDNGTQLKTEIMGDFADDVMSVYREFAGKFFDE